MAVKILIVDDASFTRDLIRRTVRKQFPAADIEDAINGRKAQQALTRTKFDMILCDWEMPEMTGLELLEWCREQEGYQKTDVPFIMITSRGDKDHVVEAVKNGVTDYLGKPFSSEQLINKIVGSAKKHKFLDRLTSQSARGNPSEKDALESLTGGNGAKGLSGHAAGSMDVLLSGKKAKATSASDESKITQPQNSNKLKDVKIPTMVRFSGKQFRTMVIQFNKTEATLLIKSDDVIPSVLEQAVLDLEFKGDLNRLNYYVQSVATTDKKPNSAFLTVILGLIDQDAEKEDFIKSLYQSL
ncbi:response regulator [Marinomonas agarivorans]|nr:response regulator [Marinomonas agarivorans]